MPVASSKVGNGLVEQGFILIGKGTKHRDYGSGKLACHGPIHITSTRAIASASLLPWRQ